ncbi:hypothetical protein KC336_g16479 [Hortaea werneckii]|nr:hypothetical protein KC336_g16479 [Hortaea werneckii]
MALKSVGSCTLLSNGTLSLANCSPDIASNLDQYPSYADCDEGHATNGTDGPFGPLIQALTDCSSDGVPRGGHPCVNFVAVEDDTDIEQFVSCLADHDAAPTFNSTGIIRDAYCVPPAEAQRNGEEVQAARQNSTASSTTASSSTGTATGTVATGSETSGADPNAGTGWFKLGLLGLGLWAAVGMQ